MALSETTRAVSFALNPVSVGVQNLTCLLRVPGCFQKKFKDHVRVCLVYFGFLDFERKSFNI